MDATAPAVKEQKPAVLIYDADAEQRVKLLLETRGKMFSVYHRFRALTDEDILAFERNRKQTLRMTDREEKREIADEALIQNDEVFEAAVELWNSVAVGVEKYALRNGAVTEDNFRQIVVDGDKVAAVQQALLAVEIMPLPLVEEELFYADEQDATSTIKLRCLFNNAEIETSHVLRSPTAAELRDYRSVMSRSYIVRGTRFQQAEQKIPSKAKRLGEFYDALVVEQSGYAGRVPLNHKMAVVLDHLSSQAEASGKN